MAQASTGEAFHPLPQEAGALCILMVALDLSLRRTEDFANSQTGDSAMLPPLLEALPPLEEEEGILKADRAYD